MVLQSHLTTVESKINSVRGACDNNQDFSYEEANRTMPRVLSKGEKWKE